MNENGFHHILGAGGLKSTPSERACQKMKRGGNKNLVAANQQNHRFPDRIAHDLEGFGMIIPALWSIHFHSFSSWAEVAWAAAFRATRTIQ